MFYIFINIRIQVPHGGDSSTVNVGHITFGTKDLVQTEGPSYRQIIELAEVQYVAQTESDDVDGVSSSGSINSGSTHNTRFLGPLGQSGDLFSHHYNDLAMAWSTGEYLRMDIEAQNEWGNETIVDRRVLEP